MNPLESSYPRKEGLHWSYSIPGLNDSPGVVPFLEVKDPPWGRSILGVNRLPWGRSILGLNDSP